MSGRELGGLEFPSLQVTGRQAAGRLAPSGGPGQSPCLASLASGRHRCPGGRPGRQSQARIGPVPPPVTLTLALLPASLRPPVMTWGPWGPRAIFTSSHLQSRLATRGDALTGEVWPSGRLGSARHARPLSLFLHPSQGRFSLCTSSPSLHGSSAT